MWQGRRWFRMVVLVAITACAGKNVDEGPCNLEGMLCGNCFDAVVTCSYDGVEVAEGSCDGCQARMALYDELCAAGSTATLAEIDAGMVCEDAADTGV